MYPYSLFYKFCYNSNNDDKLFVVPVIGWIAYKGLPIRSFYYTHTPHTRAHTHTHARTHARTHAHTHTHTHTLTVAEQILGTVRRVRFSVWL